MAHDLEPVRRSASAGPGAGSSEVPLVPALGRVSATARSAGGLRMLLVFAGGVLVVSSAVVGLAITGKWWVLVPVMLGDFAVTFGVAALIARLLADDGESG